MLYFTIYVKNLHNNSGYVDVCLENDQLLRDYQQYLDIGVKTYSAYRLVNPSDARSHEGRFVINLADIAAITALPPKL